MDPQKNILLVEDRVQDQALFEEVLSETSFRSANLSISDSLEKSKSLLKEQHFDIILLDLFIVDSSGIETFTALSRHCSGVPIVILTGLDDNKFALQCIELGAQDYLSKIGLVATALEKTISYSIERQKINTRLNYMHGQLNSFVHSISHDIRGPIKNLMMLTDLYKKLNEEEIFDQLDLTIGNLNQMIDNFGEFLKSINGEDEKSDVSFEQVVLEVLESLEADQTDFKVEMNFRECPNFFFNKEVTRTILFNLVSNAIKYKKPSEKVLIKVSTFKQGNFVCIKVEDSGLGIDTDLHGRDLFKLSYRVNSDDKGNGVGLYIIRTIAENHHGHIDIDSELGKGSTFTVYLRPD